MSNWFKICNFKRFSFTYKYDNQNQILLFQFNDLEKNQNFDISNKIVIKNSITNKEITAILKNGNFKDEILALLRDKGYNQLNIEAILNQFELFSKFN